MRIRAKVTALIAALFVVLGIAQIAALKAILLPSFAELERSDAHVAMRRIQYAFDSTLERLELSATDWGNWIDTYKFVVNRNRDYVTDNITDVALKQLNVNVLFIVDLQGSFVLAHGIDLHSSGPLGLDLLSQPGLPEDFPWRANLRAGQTARGFLRTNLGILMLAAAPVLDGNGHGPSRGMVIMGRLLTAGEIANIGAQAQVDLTTQPFHGDSLGDRLEDDGNVTHVYRPLLDVDGHPILTLRVELPRDITSRGDSAVKYASLCLLAAAVATVILLVTVLNRVVLTPLGRVTQHAVEIGMDKDLTTRLELGGSDEIGVLAREFNRMVSRVAESRTQLVDQSFQAGFAELAKGVLHNLGNAMTPIGVRVTRLRERLHESPADDALRAIEELSGGATDAQRKSDLEEFVRLACKELAVIVKSVEEDVSVMSRQTAMVQGTLAEQMRSARNEHVIEPVRVVDLIGQALDIVPDSTRQRLRVDVDESVRKVGVVRIARTVVRLVLQNIMINAADAVRDTGKDKGTLRIHAQLTRNGEGAEQLYLQCADDGVGIEAGNLEKVFEKGYSTKSRETNHGIGLHWCSNAIGALGGRIWAASEGPGRGAVLHCLVPLAPRESVALAGAA
ncbi:MAG TPA: CHASE4 domain-containing protein [Steroidobacteraceae bacterium]|nr:CHASE4 domain-containing protein [Steroidobacteraceae bacterium]